MAIGRERYVILNDQRFDRREVAVAAVPGVDRAMTEQDHPRGLAPVDTLQGSFEPLVLR